MAFFTELDEQVTALRDLLGADAVSDQLTPTMAALGDSELIAAIRHADAVVRAAERVRIIGAGLVATRSTRASGHSGLAQSHGHRNAAAFLQELTGCSRGDAHRQVRLGEALLDGAGLGPGSEGTGDGFEFGDSGGSGGGQPGGGAGADDADQREHGAGSEDGAGSEAGASSDESTEPGDRAGFDDATGAGGDAGADGGAFSNGDAQTGADAGPEKRARAWHAALGDALLDGRISAAQHDAILRGLGEPPDWSADAREAWATAAAQLIDEAHERTVEELGSAARTIRDRLDPEGAARRFEARFQQRAFRMWTDADGVRRAHIAFDDEGGSWMNTVMNAALRPRRGGPRFVDSEEKARAVELADDTRTNDQLAYDLILDILRAGSLAEAKTVFGARQAGVRLVQPVDTAGAPTGAAHTEDDGIALPSWLSDQKRCDAGSVLALIDREGNPLYVEREHRLFTPRQRIALAVRDGGCRWRGCDRPASYCEAHHIDEWAANHGRTDIDRGILLCRYHHMTLHHGGWRITRNGTGDFVLHDRTRETTVLKPRLALTYAWAGIDPPPKRFTPAA